MTQTYLWEASKGYPQKCIGAYDHDHLPDYLLFRRGLKISSEQLFTQPILTFECSKDELKAYDCLLSVIPAPVVNQRLAEVLKKHAADDIQLLDIKLVCEDGELEGYRIVNVIHTIRGIDHERSVYTKYKDKFIISLKRLVLKPGYMGRYQLAREEEDKGHLLVSQSLYDILQAYRFKGVRLVTPEDYYEGLFRMV